MCRTPKCIFLSFSSIQASTFGVSCQAETCLAELPSASCFVHRSVQHKLLRVALVYCSTFCFVLITPPGPFWLPGQKWHCSDLFPTPSTDQQCTGHWLFPLRDFLDQHHRVPPKRLSHNNDLPLSLTVTDHIWRLILLLDCCAPCTTNWFTEPMDLFEEIYIIFNEKKGSHPL